VNSPIPPGQVIWLTGLSGAGKSTLSELVSAKFRKQNISLVQLDGDALRSGLNRDLGFSHEDRAENLRRSAEIARFLSDQGILVVASFISPMATQRAMIRQIVGVAYKEVYIQCSVEAAIARDPKGLYKRAQDGEIKNFTGVQSSYEPPVNPELIVNTERESAVACSQKIFNLIYA